MQSENDSKTMGGMTVLQGRGRASFVRRTWPALVGAAVLIMAGGASAQQAQVVKIGFAAPLTGAQAHYGADFRSGVQMAIEDFNATKPVIGGKPVQFQLEAADDQADPRIGTTVAQKFVDDGVAAVIGHFNSGTSIPAAPIYARAGIPELATATAPAYTQQGLPTTFRLITSDAQQGSVLGQYAVQQLKFKRFAIIDDRTAYGQGVAEEFAKAVKAAGGQVVAQEFSNDHAVDFRAILTRIKAANADAVFYGGTDAQAAPLLKQMRQLAITAALVGPDMIHSNEFLKVAGTSAEGALASSGGSPLESMPGGRSYVERYKKRFGTPVELYSPYAYDGTTAVLQAMKTANSTDPHVYLSALKSTKMKGVTTGEFSYEANGDLKYGGVTVYKVVGGEWKPLQTVGTR